MSEAELIMYIAQLEDALKTYSPNHPLLEDNVLTQKPVSEFEATLQKIEDDTEKGIKTKKEMQKILYGIGEEE